MKSKYVMNGWCSYRLPNFVDLRIVQARSIRRSTEPEMSEMEIAQQKLMQQQLVGRALWKNSMQALFIIVFVGLLIEV